MWHQPYEVCSRCSMVGHSTETCPSIQYHGYYDQNMFGGFQENQGHWNDYYSPPHNTVWDDPLYSSWNTNSDMQQGFSNEFQDSPYSFHDYWTQAPSHQISDKLNHYDEMIKSINEMNEALAASNKAWIEEQEDFNDSWEETKRILDTLISQEQPSSLMTTPHELPATSAPCQPHDLIFFEDEETDLEESYEEPRDVETFEDCLKEESIKAPKFGPLLLVHGRPHDSSLHHSSSTHVLPFEASCEFVEHVDMVVPECLKSDKEILIVIEKSWREWKKRKKKRNFISYMSIAPKLLKLLPKDHEISLKRVKHLIEPRPKPPDYSC